MHLRQRHSQRGSSGGLRLLQLVVCAIMCVTVGYLLGSSSPLPTPGRARTSTQPAVGAAVQLKPAVAVLPPAPVPTPVVRAPGAAGVKEFVVPGPHTVTYVRCPQKTDAEQLAASDREAKGTRESKSELNDRYKERAKQCDGKGLWERFSYEDHIAQADMFAATMRLKPGMRLLDWGSGCGHKLEHFTKKYGVTGLGIELSDANDYAEDHASPGNLYCKADGERLEFLPSDSFDAVYSFGALYHLPASHRQCWTLLNLVRVLKPGGRLVSSLMQEDNLPIPYLLSNCLSAEARHRYHIAAIETPHESKYFQGISPYGGYVIVLTKDSRHPSPEDLRAVATSSLPVRPQQSDDKARRSVLFLFRVTPANEARVRRHVQAMRGEHNTFGVYLETGCSAEGWPAYVRAVAQGPGARSWFAAHMQLLRLGLLASPHTMVITFAADTAPFKPWAGPLEDISSIDTTLFQSVHAMGMYGMESFSMIKPVYDVPNEGLPEAVAQVGQAHGWRMRRAQPTTLLPRFIVERVLLGKPGCQQLESVLLGLASPLQDALEVFIGSCVSNDPQAALSQHHSNMVYPAAPELLSLGDEGVEKLLGDEKVAEAALKNIAVRPLCATGSPQESPPGSFSCS